MADSSSKAEDRQRSGRGRCQSIDLFGKKIGHDAKTGLSLSTRRTMCALAVYRQDMVANVPGRVQKLHMEVRDLHSVYTRP